MIVLGISAFYHDSAAALVRDGEIIAAAQEERFTRKKHDPSFPANAIRYCLREAGVDARTDRSRRLLRKAVLEIRAAARNLSRLRAARLRFVSQGDAAVDERKAVSARSSAARSLQRSIRRLAAPRNCSSPNITSRTRRRPFIRRRSIAPPC